VRSRTAQFLGVPATGRQVTVQVMDAARVRNGRFSEHWGLVDLPTLMTQLGVAAPMR
jgi:predicted ester cyclase